MKILIASGIYPPDIGGPAQYARNLYETWKSQGHDVKVAAYRWERAFPPLVRHILYFLKILRKGWNADLILVLDTWSAAVPAMYACAVMHKKYALRTGGDFLWESYTERTGDLVLFKDFYSTRMDKLSRKERLVFKLGGKALRGAQVLIFSTEWQQGMFTKAYGLDPKKMYIIANQCGERVAASEPQNRIFVAGSRSIKLKNMDLLKSAFEEARTKVKDMGLPDIELDTGKAIYASFVEKIRCSYAVIVASISEMSPNLVMDAVQSGVPFIMTQETGVREQLKDVAVLIDPMNRTDIVNKIVWMADPSNRDKQSESIRKLDSMHSWEMIAQEILDIWKQKI